MSKVNELRTKRAKTWEQAKAFLDSHRSENGILSAEDTETYERMEQEIVDLGREIEGYDVLIVEDILDSGMTLSYLMKVLTAKNPASIRICTLLDKPARRKAKDVFATYAGFEVPDAFVVGYGLDYAELYRNLPYIGILKPEVYENK